MNAFNILLTYILMPNRIVIFSVRLPCFHVSNSVFPEYSRVALTLSIVMSLM